MRDERTDQREASGDSPAVKPPSARKRMNEDVPTWCDCCSCEPEPRWAALAEELEQKADRSGQ